jgi:hypothetical protein
MTSLTQRLRRYFPSLLVVAVLLVPGFLHAQSSPAAKRMTVQGYVIDAEIDTSAHHLTAKSVVTFTAPETADVVTFGFHPALKLTKVTDDTGKLLTGDRTADGSIRITPADAFCERGRRRIGLLSMRERSRATKTVRLRD